MRYKVSETPLRLREYGRNIQGMVEFAKSIEDRERRTLVAHEIVRIMSNLNPNVKEIPDYKQKLWDHIHMIANYQLDVDCPYPVPDPELEEEARKKRMPYYKGRPRYRQYGWNIQLMVQKAAEMEDGPEKTQYINTIANTMQLFLRNLDRESTPESVIAEHIRDLSSGKLQVNGEDLTMVKLPVNFHQNANNQKNHRYNGKRNRGGKRKRRNN